MLANHTDSICIFSRSVGLISWLTHITQSYYGNIIAGNQLILIVTIAMVVMIVVVAVAVATSGGGDVTKKTARYYIMPNILESI